MIAGTTVQNNSNGWDSRSILFMFVPAMVLTILYVTVDRTKTKIVKAWLWKKINCSIKGDEAFWNLKADHVEISK